MKIGLLVSLLVVPLAAMAQPGSIQVNVTGSDTNEPLAHAAVMLRPVLRSGRAGAIKRGDTDAKGAFTFSSLAPGNYILNVEHAGYLGAAYTVGTAAFRGMRFTVKAGELKQVRMRLAPLGVVAGVVTGPDGHPLERARVALSHYRAVDGVRVLVPERDVLTDAGGNFRVSGVPAGQYLLSAYSRNEGRLDDVAKIYPPSYYPGVPTPAGAQSIEVAIGRTAGDLKLQLGAARGFAISGQVNDASGLPVAGATVPARRQPEDGIPSLLSSESLTVKSGATGQFMMTRLTPGVYRVMVSHVMLNQGANPQKVTGSRVVDLRSGDVHGAAVTAGRGAAISGKIVFEGTFPGVKGQPNPRNVRLAVRSQMDAGGPGLVRGEMAQDSTFRMEDVPEGPARLSVSLVNDAYYIKSISLNGQDLTNEPLNVVKGGQMDGVQVVISLAGAQVGGRVAPEVNAQPGGRKPVVVLFPEDSVAWRASPRLIKVAHVDGGGLFTFRGVAPGNYRMVAVRGLEMESEMERAVDPAFLGAVQGQARQVTVNRLRASGGILQPVDAPR